MKTFLLLVFILILGCSKKSPVVSSVSRVVNPDFSKLSPDCFTALSSNPVLTRNTLLAGSDWNDPSVLKLGSQFVMYASSDVNFNFDISIYRLVSSNGVTWSLSPSSPVFQADANGAAWDHRAVETPSVVFFNGLYHLFYSGYPANHLLPKTYKIGHATSVDGISWTRSASFIVAPHDPNNTTPDMTFNQWITAEPAAVVFQNKIYLYFSALGANAGTGTDLQVIGLTTSSDGITWSAPQSVLVPNQVLYPRASWVGYSTPNAIVLNGSVHLFFDVISDPWKQVKIHHASSSDGITNWNLDSSSIFDRADFSWSSNEIRSPSVLLDGTNLFMWFAGDDGSILSIGKSTCIL